jgi:NAD(P)-dependent dehydrogenase (short-subunit alcohol dehydrogenase family)
MAPNSFVVVAGVGPGTGAAVARRFAKSYPIALLARSPEKYESLVQEINGSGGQAIGISTDVSSEESVKSAFTKIEREFQSAGCAAAVFNASAPPARKPLLEMSVEDFSKNWNVSAYVPSLVVFHPFQKIQPWDFLEKLKSLTNVHVDKQ